jgi:hypothetical protein
LDTSFQARELHPRSVSRKIAGAAAAAAREVEWERKMWGLTGRGGGGGLAAAHPEVGSDAAPCVAVPDVSDGLGRHPVELRHLCAERRRRRESKSAPTGQEMVFGFRFAKPKAVLPQYCTVKPGRARPCLAAKLPAGISVPD